MSAGSGFFGCVRRAEARFTGARSRQSLSALARVEVNPAVHHVAMVHVACDVRPGVRDVAAEEPLEIRLGGQPFVVIMRTPGADRDLATGFLLSEQIIRGLGEVSSMRYCVDADEGDANNVLNVWLTGEAAVRAQTALAGRRHVTANSACGVCGRRSIDDLIDGTRRIDSAMTISRGVIERMPDTLRAAQPAFEQTGGIHAATLLDADGTMVGVAEDVGRHNAVDKVIGAEFTRGRWPLSNRVLFVSGRTSFEIVQKGVVAGVPIIAAVSAPSSLAIELAQEANVTLLGFVRNRTFNVYSGVQRIRV